MRRAHEVKSLIIRIHLQRLPRSPPRLSVGRICYFEQRIKTSGTNAITVEHIIIVKLWNTLIISTFTAAEDALFPGIKSGRALYQICGVPEFMRFDWVQLPWTADFTCAIQKEIEYITSYKRYKKGH